MAEPGSLNDRILMQVNMQRARRDALEEHAEAMYEALKAFKSEYPVTLTETNEEWVACNYCQHSYPPGGDKHNKDCPWGTAQALITQINGETK